VSTIGPVGAEKYGAPCSRHPSFFILSLQIPICQVVKEVGIGFNYGFDKSFDSPATGSILAPAFLFHLTSVDQGRLGTEEVMNEGA